MKQKLFLSLFGLALFGQSCSKKIAMEPMPSSSLKYVATRMDNVEDNYHGQIVKDPYRWLEDDNSAETKAWVIAQNEVTNSYLSKLPQRQAIKDRLTKLWNYEKYSAPFKIGKSYYYFKNNGLQNQSVMYRTDDLQSDGTVVLDPNTMSAKGTVALGAVEFSKNGRYMAYFLAEGGSDWMTAYVKDMETNTLLADKLEWIKFSSIAWQGNGFYYSRYPAPGKGEELSKKNEYHAVYYHQLGDDQAKDRLVFVDKDHAQRNVYASTSEDEQFLVLSTSESTSGNALYVADLSKGQALQPVITTFDNDVTFVNTVGDKLLFLSNENAPMKKLMALQWDEKAKKYSWTTMIPESTDPLESVGLIQHRLFATYMHNASSMIKVFDEHGHFTSDLRLPGIGTCGGVQGKKDDTEGFYSFTSFTVPNTIYRLNVEDLSSTVFKKPVVDFDQSLYETTQEWFTSKDGTKVPVFITKKKGLVMDGQRPTLLYGYGGFDVSITPSFSVSRLSLLENDGIYVVANIRGGGEFGSDWHKAGTLGQKQNVFDDFIGAAEYLIQKNYTNSSKLAIQGGSNGGLLVGACMTQRPDLFAVAFPAVGVLDMLRYHLFTIGWAWAADYGKSDDANAFNYLIKYSPLHNVKKQAYPATLITTADHDDRVVPAHSFKFAAELQSKQTANKPTLIRIDTSAGHGAGKPTSKMIDEAADIMSFMFENTHSPIKYSANPLP